VQNEKREIRSIEFYEVSFFMATNNSAVLALQLEKVRKNLPTYFQKDYGFFSLIKAKAGVEKVSSRAMRIPVKLGIGGAASQVSMDGDDLGVGTSATYDVATVTPNYWCKSFSLTKAAEYATNSDTKAIENAAKQLVLDATDALLVTMESLLNTDGSATLGSVSSISGSVITLVGSANMFQPGQIIQVFPSLGGTSRGSATISGLSANSQTITLASVPAGTAASDLLILAGAPGTAASSLFGKLYVNSAATTGTYLGLSRTTYPQLRSNHISGGSAALTLAAPRLLLNSIRRVLGIDASTDVVFCMNTDQSYAWEALATTVQRIDLDASKRDATYDLLAANAPITMAGRKILESIQAPPGRIDAINVKTWGRGVVQDADLLEFGGQTVFPQISTTSGGVASASLGYVVVGMSVFCDTPQANGYIDGLAITANS
jgi:hypothetical protein